MKEVLIFCIILTTILFYTMQLVIVFDNLLSSYGKQYERKVDFLLDLIPFRPFIKQVLESFNKLN